MALPGTLNGREWDKFVEDGSGNVALRTTATISGDVNVDSTSVDTGGYIGKASGTNADFTTAYASATTLTCSSLPTNVSALKAGDIITIVQVGTGGGVTNTYSRDDITLSASGTDPTTLTVAGAAFINSDTFIVYTNIERINDKVNTEQLGGNDINVNGGVKDTGTQTTTLATDDPAVTALEKIDDWDATHDSAIGNDGAVVMAQARDGQLSAVAEDDATRLVTNLYGELVNAGHTWATSSDRSEEVDPVSQQYVNESLVDTTNVTAATHYYPSSTGSVMDGYADLSVTGKFIDGDGTLTLTLEVSNDDDSANADWNAIKFFDDDSAVAALVASLTVTNGTLLLTATSKELNYRRYRWKVVASGATNTVILKQRKKAL